LEFVTHRLDPAGNRYLGHYFVGTTEGSMDALEKAIEDFKERAGIETIERLAR